MNAITFPEKDNPSQRSSGLRKLATLILLAAVVMAISGCTITHKFGPYMGTVVDAQTGEPIEGAVVLIGFHTKGNSVGGWVHEFADAVEVLTNANGEFKLHPKHITLFRAMQIWDKDCNLTIFKPGYGTYPWNSGTYSNPDYTPGWSLPEDKHITFYLPKLLTIEERKKNLGDIMAPAGITNDKMPNLLRLESEERVNVGLSP